METTTTNRRSEATPANPRRVIAVGRRVKDGWLVRTRLWRYLDEREAKAPARRDSGAA